MSKHLKKYTEQLYGKDFIIFYDDRLTSVTEVKKKMRTYIAKWLLENKQSKLL